MLARIRKSVSCFLIGEEGQISKKSIVGLGIALSAVGVQTACAQHSSSTQVTPTVENQATCQFRLTGRHSSSHSSGTTGVPSGPGIGGPGPGPY